MGDASGRGRMEAKDFFEDGLEVWETLAVLDAGESGLACDLVEFLLGFALDVGVQGHEEEEGGEDTDDISLC